MALTLTQKDLFEAGRREALISPTRFDTAIIDAEGSDINVLLNCAATMGDEIAAWAASQFEAIYIATATGKDLDRRIYDLYQLLRNSAQSAVVTLQLTRSSTSVGATIPEGSTFSTATGKVFNTIADCVFGIGEAGPIEVRAVAQQTGVASNVSANTITLVTANLSIKDIICTNLEPAAGGRNSESDDDFRARAQLYFVTARRGTKDAIEYGALNIAGIAQATASEVIDPATNIASGFVQLYITDANGQANTALADDVEETLLEYRCLGVPVEVVPAVPQYVTIRVSGLQFEAGVNTVSTMSLARTAIMASVNALLPNATLRKSSIMAALDRIPGLIVPENAILEPAGDLVPASGSVIRTTADRVLISA